MSTSHDDELNMLREQRRAALQQQLEAQAAQQADAEVQAQQAQVQAAQLDGAMRTLLSNCLLYTSPSPRDATLSRMPSSA